MWLLKTHFYTSKGLAMETGKRTDEDIEQAKTVARETSTVGEKAQQAFAQSVASAAAGVTAASSPSMRPHGVAS